MSSAPSRRWIVAGAGALAAALGAGWSWRRWRDTQAAADAAVLWSMRFETTDGGELAMSELLGKPLVLNFWATWCAPCVREMPVLDRFHRAHWQRVRVLGLALDNARPVLAFLKQHPVGFRIALAGAGGTELTRRLGNSAGVLPFTAVFDAQGRLVQRKIGETNFEELQDWTADL